MPSPTFVLSSLCAPTRLWKASKASGSPIKRLVAEGQRNRPKLEPRKRWKWQKPVAYDPRQMRLPLGDIGDDD
jgi:hypothetical protein